MTCCWCRTLQVLNVLKEYLCLELNFFNFFANIHQQNLIQNNAWLYALQSLFLFYDEIKSLWNHFRPQINEILSQPIKISTFIVFNCYFNINTLFSTFHPSHFFLHKPFPPDTTSPAERLSVWPITHCVHDPAQWHLLRKTCQGSNRGIKNSLKLKAFIVCP